MNKPHEAKKSFVLHIDSLAVLEKLTNDQAGILFKKIAEFQQSGSIDEIDHFTDVIITPFVNQFRRDDETWLEKGVSGKIGNLKKWHPEIFKKFAKKEITLEQAFQEVEEKKLKNKDELRDDAGSSHPIAPDRTRSRSIAPDREVSLSVSVSDSVSDSVYNSSIPTLHPPTRKNLKNALSPQEKQFEIFWKKYIPVKTTDNKLTDKGARKPALQAFLRALSNGTTFEQILVGTARYFAHCRANNSPTCHVSTFLNQERFLNEYEDFQEAEPAKKSAADEWAELEQGHKIPASEMRIINETPESA